MLGFNDKSTVEHRENKYKKYELIFTSLIKTLQGK